MPDTMITRVPRARNIRVVSGGSAIDVVAVCSALDVAEAWRYATVSSRLYPVMSLRICLRRSVSLPPTARILTVSLGAAAQVAVSGACRSMVISSVSKSKLICRMAESILRL